MRSAAVSFASVLGLALPPAPAAAAPETPPAAPVTVDSLLAGLAASPGIEARFVEEKHIALLTDPLRTEGTIHYARPGRMARHATKPVPSSLVVLPDRILLGDARGVESIPAGPGSAVRDVAAAFLSLLEGDRTALLRLYKVDFAPETGTKEGWRVVLTPRQGTVSKVLTRLEVRGAGLVVSELVVEEVGGDRSVTRFHDVDPRRTYSEEERRRVFAVAGSPAP